MSHNLNYYHLSWCWDCLSNHLWELLQAGSWALDTSAAFLGIWFCFDPHLSPAFTWLTCTPSSVPIPEPVLESLSQSYGQFCLGALPDRDGCGLQHLVWRPWSVGTHGKGFGQVGSWLPAMQEPWGTTVMEAVRLQIIFPKERCSVLQEAILLWAA